MPQITITNNASIRYQIDHLITKTSGIFTSLAGAGFNLLKADTVTGFSLSVNEPAHTAIYYAFKANNYWFSLNHQGMAQNFSMGTPSFDDLKEYGNTTAELRVLTDIPSFAGQNIQIAVGLEADDVQNAKPSVNSIAVNWRSNAQQTVTEQYSAVYELGQSAQIASCTADTVTGGDSDLEVTAQVTKSDGTVTEWLPLDMLKGQTASKIQLRGTYSVGDIGTGTAQIRRADIVYSDGSNSITGQDDAELYSVTQDWYMPVKQARLTVKHTHLEDSEITAYACLRDAPVIVNGETLGIGTGGRKTYQTAHPQGIKYDTVRLYFDGSRVYTGYEVNTEVGRITCEAPEGVIVSCDYEYGWENESWHDMRLTKRETLPDYDQSEYRFELDGNAKSVCAFKLGLHMESGHTDFEALGFATGTLQTAMLPHTVRDGHITLRYDGERDEDGLPPELDGRNYELLDDPRYIRFFAPEGVGIYAFYDWVSDTPVVYQFAGVLSE